MNSICGTLFRGGFGFMARVAVAGMDDGSSAQDAEDGGPGNELMHVTFSWLWWFFVLVALPLIVRASISLQTFAIIFSD